MSKKTITLVAKNVAEQIDDNLLTGTKMAEKWAAKPLIYLNIVGCLSPINR